MKLQYIETRFGFKLLLKSHEIPIQMIQLNESCTHCTFLYILYFCNFGVTTLYTVHSPYTDDSTSLRLSCEEGYVLSCMFGASYGSKEPNQECSEWDTQEDMDQYPVLPESVWESDCAGHNACTLELGHVGSGENTCLDLSGVVNAYYDSVNGVEMDDLDWSAINGFKKDCQFVALKVQALCEKEVVEEEDV